MPGGDGTGPMGMGPMTGRSLGYCGGFTNAMPGRGPGRGRGRGIGRGVGFGWASASVPTYPSTPNREQMLAALNSQAEASQRSLEEIQARVSELETNGDK